MKRLTALVLLAALLFATFTALPKEERAFAVALCVEKAAQWRVHARIPTYESGGGYRTITGEGESLESALTALASAAPMHLHLSQLRLLVFSSALADSDALADALTVLSARADMRLQCAVVMTDVPGREIADALKPTAGARLSKSIDVLLETHAEQGSFLPLTLAELLCMGQRQTPVLMHAVLADQALSFRGGYALTADLRHGVHLAEEDIRLLAFLGEQAREMQLTLPGLHARVREVRVRCELSQTLDAVQVHASLRVVSAPEASAWLNPLADACSTLLTRLSAAGCDVLGMGRKAILRAEDMAAWHALDWPGCLRDLNWYVTVDAQEMM